MVGQLTVEAKPRQRQARGSDAARRAEDAPERAKAGS